MYVEFVVQKIKKLIFNIQQHRISNLFQSLSYRIVKFFLLFKKKLYGSEVSIRSWSDDGN